MGDDKKRRSGCCADSTCNDETCMVLPDGESCATCVFTVQCCTMFGHKPEDTVCDFFPRRFQKRPAAAQPTAEEKT